MEADCQAGARGHLGQLPASHLPGPEDAASCPAGSGQKPEPAGESRGGPPPSPFPLPQSLALLCVRDTGTLVAGAPDHPAGKKVGNLEIFFFFSFPKKTILVCFFFKHLQYHNSG